MAINPRAEANKILFMDTTGYPLPGTIVPCLLCTKPFMMRKFVGEPDQICGDCMSTYAECAVVRCSGCDHHPVICRLTPKLLNNGFLIEPHAVLHCGYCNICRPGIAESPITEILNWETRLRPRKSVLVVPGFRKQI